MLHRVAPILCHMLQQAKSYKIKTDVEPTVGVGVVHAAPSPHLHGMERRVGHATRVV